MRFFEVFEVSKFSPTTMMRFARAFSSGSRLLRTGYSTVEPVHHLVKIRKARLKPKYQPLVIPKTEVESVGYRPTEICQDRVYTQTGPLIALLQARSQDHRGRKKEIVGHRLAICLVQNIEKAQGIGSSHARYTSYWSFQCSKTRWNINQLV